MSPLSSLVTLWTGNAHTKVRSVIIIILILPTQSDHSTHSRCADRSTDFLCPSFHHIICPSLSSIFSRSFALSRADNATSSSPVKEVATLHGADRLREFIQILRNEPPSLGFTEGSCITRSAPAEREQGWEGWMDTYTNAVGKERPRPTRNMHVMISTLFSQALFLQTGFPPSTFRHWNKFWSCVVYAAVPESKPHSWPWLMYRLEGERGRGREEREGFYIARSRLTEKRKKKREMVLALSLALALSVGRRK